MYKSPIEIYETELETQLEGEILRAVKRVGVSVDKDELIKALKYDRDQYNEGYHDASEKQIPKRVIVQTLDEDVRVGKLVFSKGVKTYKCQCGKHVLPSNIYCSDCGQKLDWGE
jgi:hypothetical protein